MDRHIYTTAKDNKHCCRIQEINGMRPLTATILISNAGDAKQFKNALQIAAYRSKHLMGSQNAVTVR